MSRPRFLNGVVISVSALRSGLGNRIRALLGAKSLAESEGRAFAYVWPTGHAFGSRLDELWRFDAPVMPGRVSRAIAPMWPYRDHTLAWLDDRRRREFIWQIATSHALQLPGAARPWQEHLRSLAPVRAVAERIRGFFNDHLRGRPYVGVMIRAHRSSHVETKKASPVEWYLARMRALSVEHPGIRFFVSSDVGNVADAVAASIPGVVTQPDKGEYNTRRGLQAAVADLYLLASAGYILGPYWSSFAETAQHLAGGLVTLESSRAVSGPGTFVPLLVTDPLNPWARV